MRTFVALALAACLVACGSSDPSRSSPAGSSGSGAAGGEGGGGVGGTGGDPASGGGGAGGEPVDPRFLPLIEAIEKERGQRGAPGVAVAVVEGGEVTFAAGFGSKDPNADVPVLPTTLFRIGSVQKMLTSTALLQQVDAGAVELGAPITEVAPDFDLVEDPTWAPSILARHLLTHSSSLADYLAIDVPVAQQSDQALGSFLLGQFGFLGYLMAPAGAFWNYSNPNFYLAGYLVERASGQLYRDYMRQRVFEPLGMTRTFHLAAEVYADGDYAIGKSATPGVPEIVQPDTYENAWARPAGYASSSVLDLAKFVAFLQKGDPAVLSDELRVEMQSPQVDTQEILDVVGYGYGLEVTKGAFFGAGDFRPIDLVQHGGDIPGFAADVVCARSMDVALVFLANADGAHFTDSIVTALETLGTPPDPVRLPSLDPDDATLDACAGVYMDDFNVGEITVEKDGGTLRVQMPLVDQANIPYQPLLQPISPRSFVLAIQGTALLVTFIDDETGTTRYLRTRAFVGIRPDPAMPPAPLPPDPQALATRLDEMRRVPELPVSVRRRLLAP